MRVSALSVFLLVLCTTASLAQGVAIPYFESFESPSWPGPEWTITLSAPAFGRILAVAPSPVSPDGGLAANFDVSTSPNYSTNELVLTVNLTQAPSAVLRYWAKETGDETNVEDGLFLNDGVSPTWVKVVDHSTLTASWIEISITPGALATANGLAITSNFKIRFSQRDNFPSPTDGLQIDGVRILAPSTGQANSLQAFLDVNAGTNSLGQPSSVGNAGPFFAAAAVGGQLTLTVQGSPNQPYILLAGGVNANNAIFPGIGSLDIGLLGSSNLTDVIIVIDGTAPGFLSSLAKTGPTGSSMLAASIPALPPGPWLAFQAVVFNGPALTLTAATLVTVL